MHRSYVAVNNSGEWISRLFGSSAAAMEFVGNRAMVMSTGEFLAWGYFCVIEVTVADE